MYTPATVASFPANVSPARVMVELYSRPLLVTYKANYCSCASCCALCHLIALLVLPYIASFGLGGMWTKESLVREQPKATFQDCQGHMCFFTTSARHTAGTHQKHIRENIYSPM